MGILSTINSAFDKFNDLVGEVEEDIPGQVDDYVIHTAGSALKLGAGLVPGLVLDAARVLPGVELEDQWSTKAALSSGFDLLGDEKTITGGAIGATFEGFNWLYRNAVENPLETLTYMAFDQESWSQGWDLAKDRTLGQTIVLHANDADQALGTTIDGWNVPGVHSTDANAWEKFSEANTSAKYLAGAIDIATMFGADPGFLLLKVGGKAHKLATLGNPEWRMKQRDKMLGFIDKDGVAQKGMLDDLKNDAELLAVAPALTKEMYAGPTVVKTLLSTNRITDDATRINVRHNMWAAVHGDEDAWAFLNENAPAIGRTLKNIASAKSDANVLEVAAADAANAGARLKGEALPTNLTPEVTADTAAALDAQEHFKVMAGSLGEDSILQVTASGKRALARTRQQGLVRDGSLHTGFDKIDAITIPKPVASVFMADSPFSIGAQVFSGGFKQVTLADFTASAVGWGTGIAPLAKGLTKASDSLRSIRVYGELNVEDPQLSIKATAHMMRVAGADEKTANAYISRVSQAQSPATRAQAVTAAQDYAIRTIGKRHGYTSDEQIRVVEQLSMGGAHYTKGMVNAAESQRYAATRSTRRPGQMADEFPPERSIIAGDQGATVLYGSTPRHPILNTQTVNSVYLVDLQRADRWLRRDELTRSLANFAENHVPKYDGTGRVMRFSTQPIRDSMHKLGHGHVVRGMAEDNLVQGLGAALEGTNSFWKRSVLLTRAGSYAIRNTLEEQMRLWSMGFASAAREERSAQRRYLTAGGKIRPLDKIDPDLSTALDDVESELDELYGLLDDDYVRTRMGAHEQRIADADKTLDARRAERLRKDPSYVKHKRAKDDIETTRAHLAELRERADELRPFGGTRTITLKDGTEVTIPEAYAKGRGMIYFDLNRASGSGFDTWDREGTALATRVHRLMEDSSVHLPAPHVVGADLTTGGVRNWYQEYEHILNRQIAQDAAGRYVLKLKAENNMSGDELKDAVEKWLRSSKPEAIAYRKANPLYRGDHDMWSGDIADMLDDYVRSPGLAKNLLAGEVDHVALRKMFENDTAHLPDHIHRGRGSVIMGTQGKYAQAVTSRMFKAIDQGSLQRWSRHPMFSVYYQSAVDRRLNVWQARIRAERGDNAMLTTDEISEVVEMARRDAAHKLKQTFYDASVRSSAAHQLRFIYPFFAAHQDSMRFWGNTFAKDPAAYRKLQLWFQAPTNLGVTVDKDGRVKSADSAVDPLTDKIVTQIPFHGPGTVNISSAMLMLQSGSIFNPGAGPIAAVPAAWFQKHLSYDPDVEKIGKFFNPYGAPKDEGIAQALATPIKRFQDVYEATVSKDSDGYIHILNTRLVDAHVAYRNEHDGRSPSPKTWDKIVAKTAGEVRSAAWMRAALSVVSPAQPQQVSAFESMKAEYRRLQERSRSMQAADPSLDLRMWADNQFVEKYGEAFYALTKSQTEMRGHMNPSRQTMAQLRAYPDLRNSVPMDLWGVMVGKYGSGAYSTDAYRAMQEVAMNDKGEKIGKALNPDEFMKRVRVGEGWLAYNKELENLQADAQARGYELLEEDPEFMADKKAMTAKIMDENPVWRSHRFDGGVGFDELLDGAERLSSSRALLKDPARGDIRVLNEYVMLHRAVEMELRERDAAGGSGEISAQSNADLRLAYSRDVGRLRESNTEFSAYAFPALVYKDPFYDEDLIGARVGFEL